MGVGSKWELSIRLNFAVNLKLLKKKYYLKRNYVSSQDEFIFQPEKKNYTKFMKYSHSGHRTEGKKE